MSNVSEQSDRKVVFVDHLRMKWPWFDHGVRAVVHFIEHRGRFYAAGITYFSILGLFPVLMVAFSIAGIVLFRQPGVLADVQLRITEQIPGDMGNQISELMDTAVKQRSAVGVIGFLTALYSGLGWIGHLRDGITAQWAATPQKLSFVGKKGKDFLALLGLFVSFGMAMLVSALSSSGVVKRVAVWLHMDSIPGMTILLSVISLAISLLAIWLVLLWVIGFLPRVRIGAQRSSRAALLSAVLLVIWVQIAAFYLTHVLSSPAGAVFGPIMGIMVFLFFTWQIILLGTAWAATGEHQVEEKTVVEKM